MASNSAPMTLGDYGALIRRRRVFVLSIVPTAVLLSVFIAYILPALYRASAVILLEPSTMDADVKPAVLEGYAEQQIQLVQRQVMAKDQIVELIRQLDPYPDRKDLDPLEKAQTVIENTTIERVDPVTMLPLQDSNAFAIHYDNPNPGLASAVAQRLADQFLNYNRKSRTERASEAYNFLLNQSKQLDSQIRELEQRRADFKRAHANALPDEEKRNQDNLERARRDLDNIEGEIRVAQQKESLLSVELSQVNPSLIGAVQDTRTQIATLQAELADARQKYTADHPDIKRLQRAIADLTVQASAGSTAQAVTPDNPDYLRVASELQSSRQELAALRTNSASTRAQIQGYESQLERSPTVERDYLQLERDYQVAQEQFQDVQKKLRDAEYTKAVESEQHGDRFTLIHPPHPPEKVFSPNRLGIILLGVVLGVVLAGGLAAFADSSDPTVRSARDLLELPAVATVGAVPLLYNQGDQLRMRRRWGLIAVTYILATVLVALTVTHAERRAQAAVAQAQLTQ